MFSKRKISHVLLLFISIFYFNVWIIGYSFGEEGSPAQSEQVTPYYPANTKVSIDKEKFKVLQQGVEQRLSKMPELIAFRAFRRGDKSICDKAYYKHNIQDCKDKYDLWLFLKYLAEEKCGKIEKMVTPYAQYGQGCSALKRKSCKSLDGYQKMLCEAFLKRDTDLCRKAFDSREYIFETEETEFDTHE